jgi:hypothetical protein
MKNKLSVLLSLAMLLASMFAVLPAAYAATTIDLTPSNNIYTTDTASVGTKFNVTVSVSGATVDLGGAQIYMEFNDNIINVTRWWYVPETAGGFMPEPVTTLPTPPDPGYVHISAGRARIQVAVNKGGLPPSAPWGHNGKIAIIELKITAIPPKYGQLNCTLLINHASTYLLDSSGAEVPNVIKNNGFYKISWSAPPSPNMGLDPLTKTFGPDPPSAVGQAFNEKVLIKNLSPAWYLTGASFDLTFNATVIDVIGGVVNVTIDPLWGTSSVTFTVNPNPAVLDFVSISVSNPSSNPSGNVLVATIKFTVMMQQNSPPAPLGTFDKSDLTFSNVVFMDHVGPIQPATSEQGEVKVYSLRKLELPWLEVDPSLVEMGPEPSIGKEFTIGINLTGPPPKYLDQSWYLIGVQFRLFYCPDLLEVVEVTEGPFLQDPKWNLHGTFFMSSVESDGLGPHVLVGELLLPNGTGYWDQTEFPNGKGIVTYVTFKVLKQECPDPFECNLTLQPVFGEWAINREGDYIPFNDPINGLYRILPFNTPGREIDVYGGAKNDGYWTEYPAPFTSPLGGQGPNHWMDLVFPQSEVTLYAYVTYNYWPVQSKDVGFEIEGPFEKLQNGTLVPKNTYMVWAKRTATTNASGIAQITYRMPWPCENPDSITGIWKVTATVTLADQVVIDTMIFYYERPVYIVKVTTDKFYYVHEEYVKVTVCYKTHAVQTYPALFAIVLEDDLGVPFGMALHATTVGGATFCTWKQECFTKSIYIPKWAYAGYGMVYTSVFDKDPTEGGESYSPEYIGPQFQIGPY